MTIPEDTAGRLSLVGTPIGNLEDISARAVRVLGEADVVYCEDTRRTRKLFSALGIAAPRLVRLDRHNEAAMAPAVIAAVRAGKRAVLVSDAGMPTVSDPGQILVREVALSGHPAEVIPGPCAVSAAIAVSGIPATQYHFAGFLPRKGKDRSAALAALAASGVAVVIYEAANRVAKTVSDLAGAFGADREVAAVRELTKLYEEVWRGSLGGAVEWLGGEVSEPRGEWVLVVGPPAGNGAQGECGDDDIAAALEDAVAAGTDRRGAVSQVAEALSVPKRRVYDLALALKPPKD